MASLVLCNRELILFAIAYQSGIPLGLRKAVKILRHVNEFRQQSHALQSVLQSPYLFALELATAVHIQRCCPDVITTNVMDHFAANNMLDLLIFFIKQKKCSEWAMNEASERGHLNVVKFLHEHSPSGCTTYAMDNAAKNGHFDVVVFLHEHRSEGCSRYAMTFAAMNGHIDIVKYLHNHRNEGYIPRGMDIAASNGFLNVVQYLHRERSEGCTRDALTLAVKHGHFDVVKFLLMHRREGCETDAYMTAAVHGHLDILRYLDDQYSPMLRSTRAEAITAATFRNHLKATQYLKEIALKERGIWGYIHHYWHLLW